jgi:hypothetical protein
VGQPFLEQMEDVAVSNSQQRISSGSLGDVAMSGTSKSHDRTPKKVNRAAQRPRELFDGHRQLGNAVPRNHY